VQRLSIKWRIFRDLGRLYTNQRRSHKRPRSARNVKHLA